MANFFKRSIKISEEKHYLHIISQGERTEFGAVLQNAEKIHNAIQSSKKKLILLDYQLTIFKLPHNEAFNLLKVFELKLTDFKEVKMAAIINPRTEEIGSFWASICRKRGFDFKTFQDKDEAINWLLDEH
ncbi:hypothetical protein [Marivirga arenosa]|uniref:Uncharacterized protein n=1 Tax=Marivirga arenosa TaxID=3059076 RepID=A0AA51ZWT6_9BACT|nr:MULTISPECIES: hypothetical protein [unclassified Marivirga]WMN07604.1 hypothetical protein QYS48_29310 [Marivirga sp. ABR2-2]WNB18190.1 hypothetical protein QYS47_29475 [Marivirga sp. BKB1-2]